MKQKKLTFFQVFCCCSFFTATVACCFAPGIWLDMTSRQHLNKYDFTNAILAGGFAFGMCIVGAIFATPKGLFPWDIVNSGIKVLSYKTYACFFGILGFCLGLLDAFDPAGIDIATPLGFLVALGLSLSHADQVKKTESFLKNKIEEEKSIFLN